MVDGALYLVKTSFAEHAVNASGDTNASFWSGKFLAVKHDVPFFIDIDYEEDFKKFGLLRCT